MKKLLLPLIFLVVIAGSAQAQFSAQLSSAETVFKGESVGGGFVGIYEDGFGAIGQYRYGMGGYTDLGGKVGIIDLDSGKNKNEAGLVLSFDVKYQVMEVRIQDPIDMSVGGITEFAILEHHNSGSLGGFLVGSYPVTLGRGRVLEPYGRLILRLDRERSDTDFNIGLNMGAALELSQSMKAFAEIQLDNQAAFFMGIEFGL